MALPKFSVPVEQEYHLYALFALAGVSLHVFFFNHGEHHFYGWLYLQAFLALVFTSIGVLSYWCGIELSIAVEHVTTLSGFVLLGLYSSLIVYRLVFHPLRRFPGPVLARVTSLWWSSRVGIKGNAHIHSLALYKQYGPFVRVGSSDLMIAHPQAVPAVHGTHSRCLKASWYDEDWPRCSIHTSRDPRFHSERRRVWSQSFSDRALRGYERRIAGFVSSLTDKMAEYSGQSVNAAKWFNYFSFDVMGDLAFGRDFGMLQSGEQHWAVALLDQALDIQAAKLPTWLFRMLVTIPSLTRNYWKFIGYCDERLVEKIKADKSSSRSCEEEEYSIMSSLLAHTGPNPAYDSLAYRTLQSDSRTIIVAGSDTTAATLSFVFYQLASHPKQAMKLRQELKPLQNSKGTFQHAQIYQAEHLNAIIDETLRLMPVPPTVIVRKTPPEGIMVEDQFIPGNMNVWTPAYVIGRSELAYERALEFIPERWYSRPELVKTKAGYAPFLTGPYGCIGRPLALMQIRLVVANLISKYHVSFRAKDDASAFIENLRDRFTWGLADLNLRFEALEAS